MNSQVSSKPFRLPFQLADDMLDSLRYAATCDSKWDVGPAGPQPTRYSNPHAEDYDEPVYIGPDGVKRFAILGQTVFNSYDADGRVSGQLSYEFSPFSPLK